MSGGMCLAVAARSKPDWNIGKLLCCSGGGEAPDNDARRVLNTYDGTIEHMTRIVDVMFVDKPWAERQRIHPPATRDGEPAGRLGGSVGSTLQVAVPQRESNLGADTYRLRSDPLPGARLRRPPRPLRRPGYTDDFVPLIPRAALHIFEHAAHMGQIECAEEFNACVLDFLATRRCIPRFQRC